MKKKTLIIVESPAKSSTISRYLGKDFVVSSSMGHVRDLNPHILSIDVENNFKPHYEELKDKKHIIKDLKSQARKCDRIFLAPDPDREGEAIAFHLQEILKEANDKIFRIMFHEITRQAILAAIENPAEIDRDKVNSQQMRRLLDRLAGYKISPVLQRKIGGPLSAGRVQSIALKLIVEREKEIQAFSPEEYWTISAELEGSAPPAFVAKLEKFRGKKITIQDGNNAERILGELSGNPFILDSIRKRVRRPKPLPPLITSTLQQEAFKKHRFPVSKTMKVAQSLYEGINLKGEEQTGLITYMRTDSFRIADAAREAAAGFIRDTWGEEYVPDKPNVFGRKGKIQDAHEAIRPTVPLHNPDDVKGFLSPDQNKIYRLVWDRFLASQMKPARIEVTTFDILNGDYLFAIKGEVIRFDGHLKCWNPESGTPRLPRLTEKETLKALAVTPKQNFTKPPPRYTEASLVKVLEEKGIGRPSTYVKIISTLGKRDYIVREERRFVPTQLGTKVAEYLDEHFSDMMQYTFTAELEKQLDQVSEGKLDWTRGIAKFFARLSENLDKVRDTEKVDLKVGRSCPVCGKDLVKKYSRRTNGWFVGCAGYPQCTHTERIDGDTPRPKDEHLDRKCPLCGKPLVKRYSPKTRQHFIGCTGYPECRHIETEEEELGDCPVCGKPLRKRFSRKTRRYFVGCSGYPDCTYIQKAPSPKKAASGEETD